MIDECRGCKKPLKSSRKRKGLCSECEVEE